MQAMALVVSPASLSTKNLDPTAALQTALTNFESALTTEQKNRFHAQIQSSNQQKPDASSVIQFVAQIDAETHARTRKSVSNRFCTFLDATRQFTNIVDTFVSSNPTIAALVWGGIKTAILVASNVVSYFDKVSRTIMVIGQICPIYREFSHLYNDSATLQQALCDYYAIVIKLFTRIVQVSQRTAVNSILASIVSPFESDFEPFQSELAEASRLVKLQVSLASKQAARASAKLQELESQENSRHRRFVKNFAFEVQAERDATQQIRIQESVRRAAKMKLYIRDQLSTVNPQIPWKQAQRQRLATTAEWFRLEPNFQAWEAASHLAILWCPGRMGVGKTVLVSNIIAYLHTSLQANDVISYHFCRPEDEASLSARNILGTLARQILDKYIEDANVDQLQSLRDMCQNIDSQDIVDLILPRLEANRVYYIIVDGLDECMQDQITIFAANMNTLCRLSGRNIKALYTGRPELKHQLFQKAKPQYRLHLSKAAVTADIEHYIDTELDDCLEKEKIKLVNPETIHTIRDALYNEHDGLLLFVRLFIEELCMLGNENAILNALGNPPRRINDLIAKRVHRVQVHDLATDAMKILRYCGCTKRPLTVNEFSELLSISTSQTSLDRASVPQNMDQIIAACHGLIYVEEETPTIHYVHHSVKHHLFNNSDTRQQGFIEGETDIHLGCLCLTYLNFNDFQRQLTKVNAVSSTPLTPIEIGLFSVRNSSSVINEVARILLKARGSLQQLTTAELARKTEDILGEAESSRLRTELHSRPYHLLDYVQSHWVWHSSRFTESSAMWHRFSACVRGENNLARRPWITDSDLPRTSQSTSIPSTKWALIHNHAALVLYDLLQKPCLLSISMKTDILQRAMMTENHRLVVAVMHSRDSEEDMAQKGLYFAAYYGLEGFLKLFIDAGVDIDADWANKFGTNALQAAAERGHLGVVEGLLAAGADVNAAPGQMIGRTALEAAAEGGHLIVLERLLIAGADVNAAPAENDGRTVLQAAAGGGHLAVVERLLAAGADVNAAPAENGGRTALQAASGRGYLAVMERLLAAGADVNAAPAENGGRTALQAAAGRGHLMVVERLESAAARK